MLISSMTIKEANDNARAKDAVAVELESTSSPTEDPTNQKFFSDDELILGRWVLVNSEGFFSFDSGEMTITRRVNEVTGMVEYHANKWMKMRLCGCCPISESGTTMIRFTSNGTFTVMINAKAMGVDKDIPGNGSRVGNMFTIECKVGGITSTEEMVFQGDKCRVKGKDVTHEFERVA